METQNWQALMNVAYDRWHKNEWSYEEMLDACTQSEREAVLLGNLNYQVNNGGFIQWVDNGYATRIAEVVDVLESVGGSTISNIISMLNRVYPYLNEGFKNKGCAGEYFLRMDDEEYEDMIADLDELDSRFYAANEEFMVVVVAYFSTK